MKKPIQILKVILIFLSVFLISNLSAQTSMQEKNIENNNASLIIYPNPATNSLNIKIPTSWLGKDVTLELYDQSGNIMLIKVFTNAAELLSTPLDLPEGLYAVKLKQKGKKMLTEKLMIEY